MKILLVEDEQALSESIARFLESEGGYSVQRARTATEAKQFLTEETSLVILDWGLPDESGLLILRRWRAEGVRIPIIFLSARAELVDKVIGLEEGANDYLTKPFEPRELLARVRTQLRGREAPPSILNYAGIAMNLESRDVTYRGERVSLVKQEYELLKCLLANPENIYSRAELLNEVWGYENYPTTRTVDFHIAQLRAKTAPVLFETVRGVGYRLTDGDRNS